MKPLEIKHALEVAGYCQADVGRSLTPVVNRSLVNAVIKSVGRSRRVEERIAQILGKPPAEIWPHWYATSRRRMSAGEMFARLTALEERLAANKAA